MSDRIEDDSSIVGVVSQVHIVQTRPRLPTSRGRVSSSLGSSSGPSPAERQAPPFSNTGALLTASRVGGSGVSALVDYLGFTAPDGVKAERLLECLTLPLPVVLPRGAMGYKQGIAYGAVRIYWDGMPGMGVHLEASGAGCRDLETFGVSDWMGFFAWLLAMQYHVSRLDVALDDHAGLLDLAVIEQALRYDHVTTRFDKAMIQEGLTIGKQADGKTIYCGSPASDVRLRFYDKAKEAGVGGLWVRCEIQARRERGQALAAAISKLGLVAVSRVIRGYLQFTDPAAASDSNVSRRASVAWWADFLGRVGALRLQVVLVSRTLASLEKWLTRQVAPSLALLLAATGGDLGRIVGLMDNGRYRWSASHRALLASVG
jgi:phage replication initiation protein